MISMEYSEYLHFLAELQKELEQLTELQPQKIEAVRAHDLEALNECMKREQVISLSLRGLERKRDKLFSDLKLSGIALRDISRHCPPEYRSATEEAVEAISRRYEMLQSAQGAARTVVEKDLRRVNRELESKGIQSEPDEHYQAGPSTIPSGMRTDFRA